MIWWTWNFTWIQPSNNFLSQPFSWLVSSKWVPQSGQAHGAPVKGLYMYIYGSLWKPHVVLLWIKNSGLVKQGKSKGWIENTRISPPPGSLHCAATGWVGVFFTGWRGRQWLAHVYICIPIGFMALSTFFHAMHIAFAAQIHGKEKQKNNKYEWMTLLQILFD